MKSKVMDAYRQLVRSGDFRGAWLILQLLIHSRINLGLGDVSYKVECILEELGLNARYSRDFNTARFYLAPETKSQSEYASKE